MIRSYGFGEVRSDVPGKNGIFEDIEYLGYGIVENCLDAEGIAYAIDAVENIYQSQVAEFGEENLQKINELNMARAPFLYDPFFLKKIVCNTKVLDVIKKFIDGPLQLHLQNGIINRPQMEHHQSSWHRDLPYQNWVCSKPLAMSALFCLNDFNGESGGTWVLPHSHKLDSIPSESFIERNKVQVNAPAGSVVIFNSMLLHCAGKNVSKKNRIGLNNMYTVPLLRQQICVAEESFKYNTSFTNQEKELLGLKYGNPFTVEQWRHSRLSRRLQ